MNVYLVNRLVSVLPPSRVSRFAIYVAVCALLAACGDANVKPAVTTKPNPTANATSPTTAPLVPYKKGGYYLDDGPGDNPPPNIDGIPDAVPHVEPLLPRSNRPYMALGVRYTPMMAYTPYKQRGIASWYGRRYNGQKTSSGEIYDMYSMTGAHTILPLPSYVRVTNLENARSVIVRINDRGPFHSDRLIDLSYAAAYKLRLLEKGSGMVEVEAIDSSGYQNKPAMPANMAPPLPRSGTATLPSSTASSVAVLPSSPANSGAPLNAAPPNTTDNPPVSLVAETSIKNPPVATGTDYVQVGAFKFKENADALRQKILQSELVGNVPVERWYNNELYRIRLGPYPSRQDAENAAGRIRQSLGMSAVVQHGQ